MTNPSEVSRVPNGPKRPSCMPRHVPSNSSPGVSHLWNCPCPIWRQRFKLAIDFSLRVDIIIRKDDRMSRKIYPNGYENGYLKPYADRASDSVIVLARCGTPVSATGFVLSEKA